MDRGNPYAPPASFVEDTVPFEPVAAEDRLVPNGRRRPLLRGVEWIAMSWRLFKVCPWLWIAAVALGYGAMILLSLIPFLNFVVAAFAPALTAGFAAMAHAAHGGEAVGFDRLFAGFTQRAGPLLMVGLMYLVLWGGGIGVMVLVGGSAWAGLVTGRADVLAAELSIPMLLGYMVMMTALGLLMMFAPPLVLLNKLPPLTAMKMSLAGSLKNVLPGIVCWLTFFPLLILSVIPLGLGLLITIPMIVITMYTAYRDIYLEPAG